MTLAEPPTADRPAPDGAASDGDDITALLGALSDEARRMVRQELVMARVELRASARHAAGAGAGFGAAALVGYLAAAMATVAAALGLAELMPAWIAFLAVGLVLAIVAGVAFLRGKRNLDALSPVPHQTIETAKEDLAWLRAQMG